MVTSRNQIQLTAQVLIIYRKWSSDNNTTNREVNGSSGSSSSNSSNSSNNSSNSNTSNTNSGNTNSGTTNNNSTTQGTNTVGNTLSNIFNLNSIFDFKSPHSVLKC